MGTATALSILFGLELHWGVLVTGMDTFLALGLQVSAHPVSLPPLFPTPSCRHPLPPPSPVLPLSSFLFLYPSPCFSVLPLKRNIG